MGENAIDIGNNNVQILHVDSYIDKAFKFVAFQGTGTTEPPPPTGVTGSRLGVVYFGQTTNEDIETILISPLDDNGIKMTDPDGVIYYYSESDPYTTQSNNLGAGIYTSDWSGSTEGGIPQNGGTCNVNIDNTGLTSASHILSCLTTSGNPTGTISAGEWTFDLRARCNTGGGQNFVQWNVYKSEIIDAGQTYNLYSNDTFLFSGTTADLTTSYTNHSIKINYTSIVFP